MSDDYNKKCYDDIEKVYRSKPKLKDARDLGFGRLGPDKNSPASGGHRHLKNVKKGSDFAYMTKLGMTGQEETETDTNWLLLGLGVAAAGIAGLTVYRAFNNNRNGPNK